LGLHIRSSENSKTALVEVRQPEESKHEATEEIRRGKVGTRVEARAGEPRKEVGLRWKRKRGRRGESGNECGKGCAHYPGVEGRNRNPEHLRP